MSGQLEWIEDRPARTDTASRRPGAGLTPWRARRVEQFIEDNLSLPLNATRLAALCGVTLSYFSRACRDTFGLPPRALNIRMRLAHAKRLMVATDEPLTQIALTCGFSDQAHFSNRFRRENGTTPAAWRRLNRIPAMS